MELFSPPPFCGLRYKDDIEAREVSIQSADDQLFGKESYKKDGGSRDGPPLPAYRQLRMGLSFKNIIGTRTHLNRSSIIGAGWGLEEMEAQNDSLQSAHDQQRWELEDMKAKNDSLQSAYDRPTFRMYIGTPIRSVLTSDIGWPDFDKPPSSDSKKDIETGGDSVRSSFSGRRVTRNERKTESYKWSTTTKKKPPDFVDPPSSHLEEDIAPADVDSLEPAGRGVSLKRESSSGHSKRPRSAQRDIDL